jgi:predicted nucleic acid-binding protein
VLAAVVAHGRSVRGRRAVDLMIAATALAYDLPLYTCDPDDLEGLEGIIDVVDPSG